jgi:hypothetical protein
MTIPGLDSYSALQLCQVLKMVAKAGASVLFTIHQPSSQIFNSFDHLILLNKGRCMYQGSVRGITDYFSARGQPCPPHYNPADWIIHLTQSMTLIELEENNFVSSHAHELGEPFKTDSTIAVGTTIKTPCALGAAGVGLAPPGVVVQTLMLLEREFKNMRRDKSALIARFVLGIFLSTLVGTLFLRVGETDSSNPSNLQSRFGALIMSMIMAMFGSVRCPVRRCFWRRRFEYWLLRCWYITHEPEKMFAGSTDTFILPC